MLLPQHLNTLVMGLWGSSTGAISLPKPSSFVGCDSNTFPICNLVYIFLIRTLDLLLSYLAYATERMCNSVSTPGDVLRTLRVRLSLDMPHINGSIGVLCNCDKSVDAEASTLHLMLKGAGKLVILRWSLHMERPTGDHLSEVFVKSDIQASKFQQKIMCWRCESAVSGWMR